MNDKVTYHQQVTYCGKPRCRKCREGIGHGPYWYAYRTANGQTTRKYIGKNLPADVQAELHVLPETVPPSENENKEPLSLPLPLSSLTHMNIELGTASLRILTLGQFRLERRSSQQWQAITDSAWQQRSVRALLAYLLCSPERRVSRSQAITTLWPETDIEAAQSKLNKSIQNLRKVLGHPSVETGRAAKQLREMPLQVDALPFLAEGEWLSLAPQEQVWIDVDIFEDLLVRLKNMPAEGVEHALKREKLLRDAVSLYSGDFLPEEREAEWVTIRRQSLRRGWSELLLELADLSIARRAMPAAIDWLDRLIASDPTNEPAVQRLIVALALLTRRGEALRAYHRFTEALQREYNAVPSEETRALYETVRQGGDLTALTGMSPGGDVQGVFPLANATMAGGVPFRLANTVIQREVQPSARTLTREIPAETIGRTHQSPLVGRAPEQNVMRTLLQEVEQSAHLQLVSQRRASGIPLDTQRRPQCLLLMGEAGIGKTRLAEEMSRDARRHGWSVTWSRIYQQESGIPYRVWTEILRKVLIVGTGLFPVQDPSLLQPLTALLPELNAMVPQAVPEYTPTRMLAPEQEQLRLWEAIGDVLKAISEMAPLLIVLDDIQWADASSYELLGYLARHLYGYPVLFVGTCRDTELPTRPPHPFRKLVAHMQREHSVKTLSIEPLTSEQIALLVSRVSSLPEETVKHIQDHAAGNPFFAEELARSTPPALPRTVAAALDHRMGRLSQSCRQLLGNAAVLGGSFEFSLICTMEAGSDLADEDTVLSLLEEAMQSGVLTEEGTGTRISYHFWHPLLVSHLYDNVSAARRGRLHRRAAEALEKMHRGKEEEVAATISHHLIKAGAEPARIAYYAELAGNWAYILPAYSEAEYHYRLAVEYIEKNGMPAEQPYLTALLERFAECAMICGSFEEARWLYEQVLTRRSHLEGQYEAQRQALLWGEMGATWRFTGDNAQARQCFERGERALREADVIGGPAWARLCYVQASLFWQAGEYDEARRLAQEALKLFEQQQRQQKLTRGTGRKTRIQGRLDGEIVDLGSTHRLLASIANARGQLTEALSHLKTALAIEEQYDDKREIAHISCNLGYLHLKKGAYEQAQAALRRSLSLAERVGDDPLTSVIFSDLGELAAASDEWEEAEEWYLRALALAERFNDREYISMWNADLAMVLQKEGKLEEAAKCIKRAWSIGRAMHNKPRIGLALVALANMRITQAIAARRTPRIRVRLLTHARQDLLRSLALEGLDAETRTRGRLSLARVSLLFGEAEKARQEIEQVIAEAQRYELAQIEARARALLKDGDV